MMAVYDIKHLAFSIIHGAFDQNSPGGCSCELCQKLLKTIEEMRKNEAADYYNEHYPPVGGL